jgi:hypothetical protein
LDFRNQSPPAVAIDNRLALCEMIAADLGVKGNWSPFDSTTAKFASPFAVGKDRSRRMPGQRIPIKGRRTAWLKIAGGVKARSPAGVPIAGERASRMLDFIKNP